MDEMIEKGKGFMKTVMTKAQKLFSRLVDTTDHLLTKTLRLLRESKEEFEAYVQDRDALITKIASSEEEITRLKDRLTALAVDAVDLDEYERVQSELDAKMNEKVQAELRLKELEVSLNQHKQDLDNVKQEQIKALSERDAYKERYQQIQEKLAAQEENYETLTSELQDLKNSQGDKQASIERTEALLKELDEARRENKKALEDTKHALMGKIKEITRLNSDYHELRIQVEGLQDEKKRYEARFTALHKQLETLRLERERAMHDMREKEAEFSAVFDLAQALEQDKQALERELRSVEDLYFQDMQEKENEIAVIKADLDSAQNELSTAHAVSDEDQGKLKILMEEYEERFQLLYKRASFHAEFMHDFYALSSSDRLKVEAKIAGLTFGDQLVTSSVRKHTVKAGGTSIPEFPFADTGRIYAKMKNDRIQFYRISRVKNGKGRLDQKRVIAWLQQHSSA